MSKLDERPEKVTSSWLRAAQSRSSATICISAPFEALETSRDAHQRIYQLPGITLMVHLQPETCP